MSLFCADDEILGLLVSSKTKLSDHTEVPALYLPPTLPSAFDHEGCLTFSTHISLEPLATIKLKIPMQHLHMPFRQCTQDT